MTRRLVIAAVLATAGLTAAAPGGIVRIEHRDPSALPIRGPANAPVTVELFFTPGSQTRQQAYRLVEQLQQLHPTRIRLVYRIIGGGGTSRLPYAALEAHAEGKFFELMKELNGPRPGFSDQQLTETAKKIGIDPERLLAAMHDPPAAYKKVIDDNERRRKQRIRGGSGPFALFNGRPPQTQLSALGLSDLEREYQAAKAAADELLDRGAAPRQLADPVDDAPAVNPLDIVIQAGPTDDEPDMATDPPLARPPLRLAGLPSFGPATAEVTLVVLCNPTSANCIAPLRHARIAQELYPEAVRVVWGPYFDVARDDASELGLLGDAALCAEEVGTSTENDFDSPSSPGWRWVDAMLAESANRHRRVPPEQLIDKIAEKLHVDRKAFATCRAQRAGAALAFIEKARHAGVRTSPSTLVGGRIYGPINDWGTLQLLVEAERAPGVIGWLEATLAPGALVAPPPHK